MDKVHMTGETGNKTAPKSASARLASARRELSYNVAGKEASLHLDHRLLDSLPWRKLNEFLAGVGTERTLEGLARRVLREIGSVVPFDYGFFAVVDPLAWHKPKLLINTSAPTGLIREYFGYYIALDPWVARLPQIARGVADWTRLDCQFTHDFLRRYNTWHSTVMGNLTDAAGAGFSLSLHRMSRSAFTERELAACFSIRPHLHNLFSLLRDPSKDKWTFSAVENGCGLTDREQQVRHLLRQRLTSGEIAESLQISRRTVEKHIEHVYFKLGVHNRRGLRGEKDHSRRTPPIGRYATTPPAGQVYSLP